MRDNQPSGCDFNDSSETDGIVIAPAKTQAFRYDDAFSRNIGWVTEWEQKTLKGKRIAIAGMGGVGGVHLLTLARLGIGAFNIADLDLFELANFNRQIGATMDTLSRPKVEVLAEMARAINPELDLRVFPQGVCESNIDAFLDGADLFVDGFDFFALDVRAQVFARCAQRGIPAITAAPLGFGTAYLVFLPGGMTFEEYFRLAGLPPERQYVNFLLGLAPKLLQRRYLMDPTRLDLIRQRGPSSSAACQLCAGVASTEALKLLLRRGPIRGAPWYHQFDAYYGRSISRYLIGGNRNPIQALKVRAAYRGFSKLAYEGQAIRASIDEHASEMEHVLDLARWAPSGDNIQPWRFQIKDDAHVSVYVRDQADEDIYDYADGQPTLISAGMLLETLRVAATKFGRAMWWTYRQSSGHTHIIDVELPRAHATGNGADPLLPFITARSVNRRPYKFAKLDDSHKAELAEALGEELEINWYESLSNRLVCAHLNGRATDIRLRIPEAFRIHQRILDWDHKFSPTGVPKDAVGLDSLTLKVMQWVMRDWKRMERLNRLPGATLAARIQMDYLPGIACAAHFSIAPKTGALGQERVPALLRAGQAMQRFWLTATKFGLVVQPSLAPLCFAHYGRIDGRIGTPFTESPRIREQAARLAIAFGQATRRHREDVLFFGRIGEPASRAVNARSVRRPLAELMNGGGYQ